MVSSEWLDIAIGVVFVWFLLALVVSVVNESINRAFAFRAKNLWRTLEQMLDNNVPKSGRWGGLIGGLAEFFHWWGRPFDPNEPPLEKPEAKPVDPCEKLPPRPAEPSDTTGEAPLTAQPRSRREVKRAHKQHERDRKAEARQRRQALGQAHATCAKPSPEEEARQREERDSATEQPPGRTTARLYGTGAVQALEDRTSPGRKTRISNIPTPVFAQGLIELLVHTPPAVGGNPPTAADARSAIDLYISRLHDSNPFKRELEALWTTANRDLMVFRGNIETWFDGQMARATRLYKKRIRIILIVVGLVVTLATFSIGIRSDSLALVSDLQHDQNLQAGLVGAASAATAEDLAALGCPSDSTGTTTTTTPDHVEECKLKGAAKVRDFDLVFSNPDQNERLSKQDVLGRLGYLYDRSHWRTWIGLLITAVALSFGATFWFDVLRRLVGIRKGSGSQA
ncbi:MAG: hypothetical protein ACXWCM_15440 [Acidimicrobiales bacterium]